jgi:hypothetical protein
MQFPLTVAALSELRATGALAVHVEVWDFDQALMDDFMYVCNHRHSRLAARRSHTHRCTHSSFALFCMAQGMHPSAPHSANASFV